MRSAFTLIELLVVVGLMGLLGTVSVGGYRAMQRGMEERGVMQNVNTLIKTAYERAQIDRQPTAIYFWNETLRSSTDDANEIVVGRAVAVRSCGRLSLVDGQLLIDEFADLNLTFLSADGANASSYSSSGGENTIYLYCLDDPSNVRRDVVYAQVFKSQPLAETYLNGRPSDSKGSGNMEVWGFKSKTSGATWRNGSVYGMEFAEITLPHGYIFGTDYSKRVEDPVKGEKSVSFSVGNVTSVGGRVQNASMNGSQIVSSLRPDGAGGLKVEKVGSVRLEL